MVLLTPRITASYGGTMRRRTSHTLPVELHERLQAVAAKLPGANVSVLIEAAVEMHLPQLEALSAAMDAPEEKREEVAMESMLRSFLNTLRKEGHVSG